MKIKELIEQLQQLDPEAYVFVRGYEGGVDDVNTIGEPTDVILDINTAWYYGKHECADGHYRTHYPNNKIVKGIIL